MRNKEPGPEEARKLSKELIDLREKYRVDLEEAKQTLRDHFAGLAMQTLISKFVEEDDDLLSATAYKIADTMMKQRDKK